MIQCGVKITLQIMHLNEKNYVNFDPKILEIKVVLHLFSGFPSNHFGHVFIFDII